MKLHKAKLESIIKRGPYAKFNCSLVDSSRIQINNKDAIIDMPTQQPMSVYPQYKTLINDAVIALVHGNAGWILSINGVQYIDSDLPVVLADAIYGSLLDCLEILQVSDFKGSLSDRAIREEFRASVLDDYEALVAE